MSKYTIVVKRDNNGYLAHCVETGDSEYGYSYLDVTSNIKDIILSGDEEARFKIVDKLGSRHADDCDCPKCDPDTYDTQD